MSDNIRVRNKNKLKKGLAKVKLEIMAKYVKVGDVLVKGAHKYTVTHVEKVAYTDLVNIVYKTLKTETIRSMKVDPSEFVKVEQVEEAAAEENEVAAENPVKLANIYIEHCKDEMESIKTLLENANDEDEMLLQKGRLEHKKNELTFLETRKSEILSKQDPVSPAEPTSKFKHEVMAGLINIGDVISKGRHKYEVTHIKEYDNTVTLFYSTIGTKVKKVRFMNVPPTYFLTVYENQLQ